MGCASIDSEAKAARGKSSCRIAGRPIGVLRAVKTVTMVRQIEVNHVKEIKDVLVQPEMESVQACRS